MILHRWQSRGLRTGGLFPRLVALSLFASLTGIPGIAPAQTVCTLVINYTGQLWHGQLGVPASFVEFNRIGGYCEDPYLGEIPFVTDIDGRYAWTSIQPYQPISHGQNVGDHIVFDIRPCQQPRICELIASWDGTATSCVPADSQHGKVPLPRIELDRSVGPPTIPPPASLYTPSYHEPTNAYIFSWSPVPKASRYILRIDTSDAPIESAHPWRLIARTTPSALVEDMPPQITWRVRALNGCSLSVWTSPTIYADIHEEASDPPGSFELSQNYPNPFNASTMILFDLDYVTDWSLTIYNILGQTIRRYSGSQSEGTQLVEWYGDDGIGNPMPSGMYFYRVETQRWSASRKMILLR